MVAAEQAEEWALGLLSIMARISNQITKEGTGSSQKKNSLFMTNKHEKKLSSIHN